MSFRSPLRRRSRTTSVIRRAVLEPMESRLLFDSEPIPTTNVTINVTSAADSGPGTLRAAIEQASQVPQGSRALITVASGVGVIRPTSPLSITKAMTLNGSVEIDGSLAGPDDCGFAIFGNDVRISGFHITNWGAAGILVAASNARLTNVVIGVKADGVTPAGNKGPGVLIQGGSAFIGTYEPGYVVEDGDLSTSGNCTIANNLRGGVAVEGDGSGVRVQRSTFYNNALGAIDLGNDGPTPNDPLDADTGPGGLLNSPVLTSVQPLPTGTRVGLTLEGRAGDRHGLTFYISRPDDADGSARIPTLYTSLTLANDGTNNLSLDIPGRFLGGGRVTATTTALSRIGGDPLGGSGTSELSNALDIDAQGPVLAAPPTASVVEGANSFDVTVTFSDAQGVYRERAFRGIFDQNSGGISAARVGSGQSLTGSLVSESAAGNQRTFTYRFSKANISLADGGTYTVAFSRILNDGFGNSALDAPLTLTVADEAPPTVVEGVPVTPSTPGTASSFDVTIAVSDNSGVDLTTLPATMPVVSTNGLSYTATLVPPAPGDSGKTQVNVVYRVATVPAGLAFNVNDDGFLRINAPAGWVKDVRSNPAPARQLGAFDVAMPAASADPLTVTATPTASTFGFTQSVEVTLGTTTTGLDPRYWPQTVTLARNGASLTLTLATDRASLSASPRYVGGRKAGNADFSAADTGDWNLTLPASTGRSTLGQLPTTFQPVSLTFESQIDTAGPTLTLPELPVVTSAVAFVDIPVTVADPSGVLTTSLRGKILRLQSGNTTRTVKLLSITPATGSPSEAVATFRLAPTKRGANLDHTFNGTFTVRTAADLARDTKGNRTSAQDLGTLTVNIPPPPPDLIVGLPQSPRLRSIARNIDNSSQHRQAISVANLGPGTFSNTGIRVDLLVSPTTQYSPDTAVLLASQTFPNVTLAANKSMPVNFTFTPTGVVASGYVVARVTAVDGPSLSDANPSNNVFLREAFPVQVAPRRVDFAAVGDFMLRDIRVNRSTKIIPVFSNEGNVYPQPGERALAGIPWTVFFRRVGGPAGSVDFVLGLGTFNPKNSDQINANGFKVKTGKFGSLEPGDYDLFLRVSAPGDVNPSNDEVRIGSYTHVVTQTSR